MTTQIHQKTSYKFICEKCDFKCSKKGDYNRHIKTKKHNVATCLHNVDKKNSYKCHCGKLFSYRQSLSRHKKTCSYIHQEDITQPETIEPSTTKSMEEMFMELMKKNQELQEQIIELASKPRNVTNNFNLNNFLNIDCKDAMNLSDFMDSITLTFKDLLYVGDNGFEKSFEHAFIDSISNMEQTKRPIHCTDLKRKLLKIKDNDIWETDKNGEKINKTIATFSNKQLATFAKHHRQRDKDFLDDATNLDNNSKMILGMCQYGDESSEGITKRLLSKISKCTTIKK